METLTTNTRLTKHYIDILIVIIFSAIIFFIAGCNDNSAINNNNPTGGCTKITPLIFPPDDTSIYSPTVDFRWFEPSCGPAYYKLIIYRDFFYDTTLTPSTAVSKSLPTNYTYNWKVFAYYGNPVNDSVVSATYDFYSQP